MEGQEEQERTKRALSEWEQRGWEMEAGLPCPCSWLWRGHLLTASQGSGTLVEFGSGFAERKIEEGPVSPIDGLFCLPGPELTEKKRQLVLTHRQETQNLLKNYRQTLTEYHSPFKRENLDSVMCRGPCAPRSQRVKRDIRRAEGTTWKARSGVGARAVPSGAFAL